MVMGISITWQDILELSAFYCIYGAVVSTSLVLLGIRELAVDIKYWWEWPAVWVLFMVLWPYIIVEVIRKAWKR